MIFVVPVAFHLARAAGIAAGRLLFVSLLVATLVTVPFLLWAPKAFLDSVVTLQLYQPFRGDSLSFPAFLAALGGPILPGGLAFVTASVALAMGLWLAARTPAGSASIVALVYYVFFASNKQAFANYYLFVIGAMCCAVAAGRLGPTSKGEKQDAPLT